MVQVVVCGPASSAIWDFHAESGLIVLEEVEDWLDGAVFVVRLKWSEAGQGDRLIVSAVGGSDFGYGILEV